MTTSDSDSPQLEPVDSDPAAVDSTATWYKVAEHGELAEGRVRTAIAGPRTIALTHCAGRF